MVGVGTSGGGKMETAVLEQLNLKINKKKIKFKNKKVKTNKKRNIS